MATSLRGFFDDVDNPNRTLVLINRSSPDAIRNLLGTLLEGQSVSIDEIQRPDSDTDIVALVEDSEVIAQSTLDDLLNSILMINSDLYKTGSRELDEVSLPAVLEGLDEIPFRVRGYPASNKEKLLLITMSRVIERRAAESGSGTLRASFQRLSRLTDEQGTRDVYEAVGNSGTDVHVYGVDDWTPPEAFPVAVHTGDSYPYRRSWFVVFTPPDEGNIDPAALVALEDEPNLWDGFWTFRPELVDQIEQHIATSL
ncbi:diguanylate cyclase/two-component system sensory protein [Halohasta litchfieldiae]|jgi:hypothetical protein|uniref:Diguanylate Cyclase and Two-component system sensory domain-containing protein n=1 Tax=Halohasta litchfieldiae TaxID=1073996 RepID=A0A1H6SUD7_9EURY|nr:DICT sensory domain-containing protein [Halohasta litchfieldiae]ATW89836.1 diguanylate cyclase/two-component system sensory protein [Halohasta litchfieldiae]SEI68387.1 Diguanylate Cyclase and Two-component system sensory domain-containing protein [Halohasta litchfieldiae]